MGQRGGRMRVRKQTPANRLVAASICLLFLGVSASAFVASTVEPPELDDTPGRADTPGGPSTLNQAGSERGSVFSNSVFELNSGSPTLVLDNGTRVTFASTNNSSNPVYTADDIVSIAGSCAILDNYSLRCTHPQLRDTGRRLSHVLGKEQRRAARGRFQCKQERTCER